LLVPPREIGRKKLRVSKMFEEKRSPPEREKGHVSSKESQKGGRAEKNDPALMERMGESSKDGMGKEQVERNSLKGERCST